MIMKFESELLRVGRNSNGNIYTYDSINDMVNKFNAKLGAGEEIFGELRLLRTPYTKIINTTKISHKVSGLNVKDGTVSATIESLDTPLGDLVGSLIMGNAAKLIPILSGVIQENNSIKDLDIIRIDVGINE